MLNSDFIVSATGAVIALLFAYFPALRTRFAGLSPEWKSGVMIGLMILTGFAVWGAGCAGWLDSGMECSTNAIPNLVKLIFLAVVGNQITHRIAPEAKDVKLVKAARL